MGLVVWLVLLSACTAALQHCDAPRVPQQAVDFVFVLSQDVCDAACAVRQVRALARSHCADDSEIDPRYAAVVFSKRELSTWGGLLSCDAILAGPQMGTHTSDDKLREHFVLTNAAGGSNPSGPPLAHVLRPGADIHLVFTPRAAALPDTAVQAYLDLQHTNMSLSFFIEPTPHVALAYGDPNFAVTYRDGSHFNKAMTLKRIIEAGDGPASSLQAHMLEKGISMRVFPLSALWGPSMGTIYEASPRLAPSCRSGTLGVQQGPSPSPHSPTPVRALDWDPHRPFAEMLITGETPMILRGAAPSAWPALTAWADHATLRSRLPPLLHDVKQSAFKRFLDPDMRTPLADQFDFSSLFTFNVTNMTADEFLTEMSGPSASAVGYFLQLTDALRADVQPNEMVFRAAEDRRLKRQFLWASSAGATTHWHFDQDFNIFVQVVGHKRFSFVLPHEHERMHPFPRIHPLWHKSQVDGARPDLAAFPAFRHCHVFVADVGPGDVLYVPPYAWHNVETLDESLSVATLSHDFVVRDNMEAMYLADLTIDLLTDPRGRLFALRLYIDMLVHELLGNHPEETERYAQRLLAVRYGAMIDLFPDEPGICAPPPDQDIPDDHIPTCAQLYHDATEDLRRASVAFGALRPERRDILLADYIEELTAQVVGPLRVPSFLRYCLRTMPYHITYPSELIHDELWHQSGTRSLHRKQLFG
eukprot:m.238801 g.238801  ORF g.238801 m.238801 type:complete len:702 (-) comp13362_c0_seq1:265-2370(-)